MNAATLQIGGEPIGLPVDQVRPESMQPVPNVQAVLLADDTGLWVEFDVRDEEGFCVEKRGFQGPVHLDSCVEIFLSPPGESAYLNVECNAGGDLHASWIRDPARRPEGGFRDYQLLTEEQASWIQITSPSHGISGETRDWVLGLFLPWGLFASLSGLTDPMGIWRMNLYKCADQSSLPHWLSWSPCSEKNFHAPDEFGRLEITSSSCLTQA